MSIDKAKLKALAEAATQGERKAEKCVAGIPHVTTEEWDIAEVHVTTGANPMADAEFMAAACPATVLALLAEIKRTEEEFDKAWRHGLNNANNVQALSAEVSRLQRENEALRKSIAGKVICDLDLFEDLRDSAAAESDQHRQSMGTYRPQRQEVLDHTVRRCDLLISATKEASHG